MVLPGKNDLANGSKEITEMSTTTATAAPRPTAKRTRTRAAKAAPAAKAEAVVETAEPVGVEATDELRALMTDGEHAPAEQAEAAPEATVEAPKVKYIKTTKVRLSSGDSVTVTVTDFTEKDGDASKWTDCSYAVRDAEGADLCTLDWKAPNRWTAASGAWAVTKSTRKEALDVILHLIRTGGQDEAKAS